MTLGTIMGGSRILDCGWKEIWSLQKSLVWTLTRAQGYDTVGYVDTINSKKLFDKDTT